MICHVAPENLFLFEKMLCSARRFALLDVLLGSTLCSARCSAIKETAQYKYGILTENLKKDDLAWAITLDDIERALPWNFVSGRI